MFKPVDLKIDFPAMERRILDWWYSSGLVNKYLHRNDSSKKKFSFFDGPITANNPMGVHHAWGRTYKDLWQRYKNMNGFRQRFQNGFDNQGLWVEVEVEKEKGFRSKKEIEKYGIEKFVNDCRERTLKCAKEQTEQSKIFPNAAFGYWKVTVERPLRLRVDLSDQARAAFRRGNRLVAARLAGDVEELSGQHFGPHGPPCVRNARGEGGHQIVRPGQSQVADQNRHRLAVPVRSAVPPARAVSGGENPVDRRSAATHVRGVDNVIVHQRTRLDELKCRAEFDDGFGGVPGGDWCSRTGGDWLSLIPI